MSTSDRLAGLWAEHVGRGAGLPKHWDAILDLLDQNTTFRLLTVLEGYQAAINNLPVLAGMRVTVNRGRVDAIGRDSGWWTWRPTLWEKTGTVQGVHGGRNHDSWVAEVLYDEPPLPTMWQDDTMHTTDRTASFFLPMSWLHPAPIRD